MLRIGNGNEIYIKINSRIMLQSKMMAFFDAWEMKIREVETIGLCGVGFEITKSNDSMTEVNTFKEMHQMSDIMFASYVVSRYIVKNVT